MKAEHREIRVEAHWIGLPGPEVVGTLTASPVRGKEVFAFEYAPGWVRGGRPSIDPALPLGLGPQYATGDTFGVCQDSSPDRWGRVLLRRREAWRARQEGRRPRTLMESDFLLGVYDGHRLGGLRFRIGPDGPFLDDDDRLASPPWTSLGELEQASRALEDDDAEDHPSYGDWLRVLLAPGRSLGGARPKASVIAPDGALWIAKFPSRDDDHDVGAWEFVVNTLARRAGIECADARCERFGGRHHTMLSRRFDREGARRLHFASAMTLVQKQDGDPASYLDLVQAIARHARAADRDLEQLWRRVAFNVCVSNVDDHLRNHGFLLDEPGWRIAPAYDMNPVAEGDGLALNISEHDNAQDLDVVREVAPWFRVSAARADAIVAEVQGAVRGWASVAREVGLSRGEIGRMESAFRVT